MVMTVELPYFTITGYKLDKSEQTVINVTLEGSLGPRELKLGPRVNCGRQSRW